MASAIAGWRIEILATMSQALCWIARGRGATANSKYSTSCRLSCWSNISRESTSSGRSLRKCAPWSNIRASISLRILRRLELFDVILCRNVLIYFDQDTKSDVLRRLAEALSSDGYLVLGAAETASLQNGQRSTGPLHAQHNQPAPSGTVTNDARAAPADCDQWRPIERISANKNPGEGRGFENTEQDFRPGFLPLLPMAPAARSRGPTRSRCNSCRWRRWRAFSGACR